MMLVDTSIWVDLDRGRRSSLPKLIEAGEAAYTEPVAMELLTGTGSHEKVQRLLAGLPKVGFDSAIDFSAAAWIYRECTKHGHTPRGIVDCMIASVAIRNAVPLLAADRDFAAIAEMTSLELIAP